MLLGPGWLIELGSWII